MTGSGDARSADSLAHMHNELTTLVAETDGNRRYGYNARPATWLSLIVLA